MEWVLPYHSYQDQLVDQAALMLTLSGRVSETQQVLATQTSFRLRTPDLRIEVRHSLALTQSVTGIQDIPFPSFVNLMVNKAV